MTMKITFIGAGNMASSLAGGMIAKGMDPINVTLSDINEQQLQHVRKQLQVNTTRDNINACQKADVVVLAVKPQVMGAVLAPLKELFEQRKPLVMSIAAGITLSQLENWIGADTPIVRCMPNTPALVETGATGLYANANVSRPAPSWAQWDWPCGWITKTRLMPSPPYPAVALPTSSW